MHNRLGQSGAARLLLLVIILVGVLAGASFFAYRTYLAEFFNSEGPDKSQVRESCRTEVPIQFCVSQPSTELSPTETIQLDVTITNISGQPVSEQFPSTCVEPELRINDVDPPSRICGLVTSKVSLSAQESKTFAINLEGASLQPGENTVLVTWADIDSEPLQFVRKAATVADRKKEANCNDGDDKPYCASITVTLKPSTYDEKSSCYDVELYFTDVGVHPQYKYCSQATIGILYFIVPKPEAEIWKARLQNVPQVQDVTLSNQ